jgi:hypothetical protein
LSKRKLEKADYRREALAHLKEQIDLWIDKLNAGLTLFVDVDQLSDLISSLGKDCLLCDGGDRLIDQTIRALLDDSGRLFIEQKEGKSKSNNVIQFPES